MKNPQIPDNKITMCSHIKCYTDNIPPINQHAIASRSWVSSLYSRCHKPVTKCQTFLPDSFISGRNFLHLQSRYQEQVHNSGKKHDIFTITIRFSFHNTHIFVITYLHPGSAGSPGWKSGQFPFPWPGTGDSHKSECPSDLRRACNRPAHCQV